MDHPSKHFVKMIGKNYRLTRHIMKKSKMKV